MKNVNVPICGQSDERNHEYNTKFNHKTFFDNIIFDTKSPTIIDVGGHKGESIRFFRNIYPNADIYSIEPDPTNFQNLQLCAQENKSQAFNIGLSDRDGESVFYRQEISHLGGMKAINHESIDSLGYAAKAVNMRLTVPVLTLETFLRKTGLRKVDILKIDVQGYEENVLLGAAPILKDVSCIQVEISLYDFYGETKGLFAIESIMKKNNFELYDISKLSKNPKNLRTDWIECVYRNKSVQRTTLG